MRRRSDQPGFLPTLPDGTIAGSNAESPNQQWPDEANRPTLPKTAMAIYGYTLAQQDGSCIPNRYDGYVYNSGFREMPLAVLLG